MPMGLNISPTVWQSYVNAILNCLSSRKYCEAIMDDLLLFTPSKESHFHKLEDLLKALCKNGLKISSKKCQLFKTELQYMGNIMFIKDRQVCVRPMRSRIEAHQQKSDALNFRHMLCKLGTLPNQNNNNGTIQPNGKILLQE